MYVSPNLADLARICSCNSRGANRAKSYTFCYTLCAIAIFKSFISTIYAFFELTVNQLVVGSIPTAGAKKFRGVNGLDHRRPLVFVSRKVINSYKLFQSTFGWL